jgi:hypothetical protein
MASDIMKNDERTKEDHEKETSKHAPKVGESDDLWI